MSESKIGPENECLIGKHLVCAYTQPSNSALQRGRLRTQLQSLHLFVSNPLIVKFYGIRAKSVPGIRDKALRLGRSVEGAFLLV